MTKLPMKKAFTLVEMLVAICLVVLMTAFLLRFFNATRNLWRTGEQNSAGARNAGIALDMMAGLVESVQFSLGEKTVAGQPKRDDKMDSIFSLDNASTDLWGDAHRIFFAASDAALPKKSNDIRFVSFRLGDPADEYQRGKLFMLVYSDRRDEARFYSLFPHYTNPPSQGNRNGALVSLKSWLTVPTSEAAEDDHSVVVAEGVIAMKINAFKLSETGALTPVSDGDIKEPPYRIDIILTMLGKEDFAGFVNLPSAAARKDFAERKGIVTVRSICIGDRWQLAKKRLE